MQGLSVVKNEALKSSKDKDPANKSAALIHKILSLWHQVQDAGCRVCRV